MIFEITSRHSYYLTEKEQYLFKAINFTEIQFYSFFENWIEQDEECSFLSDCIELYKAVYKWYTENKNPVIDYDDDNFDEWFDDFWFDDMWDSNYIN